MKMFKSTPDELKTSDAAEKIGQCADRETAKEMMAKFSTSRLLKVADLVGASLDYDTRPHAIRCILDERFGPEILVLVQHDKLTHRYDCESYTHFVTRNTDGMTVFSGPKAMECQRYIYDNDESAR